MGVTITTKRFTAPTSTGNATFTDTNLGGLTPKAVLVIASHADTDATAEPDVQCCIGFADDTREGSVGCGTQDGVTSTDAERAYSSTEVINMPDGTGIKLAASLVSFSTNNVTLNFATVDSDAVFITIVFFAGTDVSAYAGEVDPNDSNNGTTDVTAPGFQPDLVFLASMGHQSDVRDHASFRFGCAVDDGSDTNRGLAFQSNNGDGTTDPRNILSSSYACPPVDFVNWALEIGSFDANGFTVTTRLNPANSNDRAAYLALAFGGAASVNLRSFDSPTSTGNDARTGVGFEPQFVLLGLTDVQTENTEVQDADAGSWGISVFTADAEVCTSWADEDAQTTTDTQSLCDNQAINFASGDGTTQHAATFVSLDSDGHSLNYSTADGTARKWFELAIEGEAIPAAIGNEHIIEVQRALLS
jgi:hypothetical protein